MRVDSVITWLWQPDNGYRSKFEARHVNVLFNMVRRHYRDDVRCICVTDMPDGIDPSIEILPAWNDFAHLKSPHGNGNPACYRRLRLFHPSAAVWFGRRYVSLDIDCVIAADMTPVWERKEDIVLWGDTNPKTPYNGSMMLMTAGARPHAWTRFRGEESARAAFKAGFFGSDQGWLGHCLGWGEKRWGIADGVYSYRNHIEPNGGRLPDDARVTFWHGHVDPWDALHLPWVREHWR